MKAMGDHAVATASRAITAPTLADLAFVQAAAEALFAQAQALSVVLTIERRSLVPLAMRHHEPVITVWPAK